VLDNGREMVGIGGPRLCRIERTETLVWSDSYDSVRNGALLGLTRVYEQIGGEESVSCGSSGLQKRSGDSTITNVPIRFSRDDRHDIFVPSLVSAQDSALEEQWLKGLVAETDLVAFAPDTLVDVGESWRVAPGAYVQLRRIGGNVILAILKRPPTTCWCLLKLLKTIRIAKS